MNCCLIEKPTDGGHADWSRSKRIMLGQINVKREKLLAAPHVHFSPIRLPD